MITLYHYPFVPAAVFVRLMLAEMEVDYNLILEKFWLAKDDFVLKNPEARVPVLEIEENYCVCGVWAITEHLIHNSNSTSLLGLDKKQYAETRRLLTWFLFDFDFNVSYQLLVNKVFKRIDQSYFGGSAPDGKAIRESTRNLEMHLSYVEYLLETRNWLSGANMSCADFALAAHISCLDYIGHMPWVDFIGVKNWYQTMKSRPSFRQLLKERHPLIRPFSTYSDLDF